MKTHGAQSAVRCCGRNAKKGLEMKSDSERTAEGLFDSSDLRDRIRYGLYGGVKQHYISGVDGTLAQLGSRLPPPDQLRRIVARADKQHAALVRKHNKTSRKK